MSNTNPTGQYVPNYLVQSILVTIFCCLPLGIVAIVYAAQVNAKLAAGDVNGAMVSSANAKKWTTISFVVGIIVIIISIIVQFVFVGAAISSMPEVNNMPLPQ